MDQPTDPRSTHQIRVKTCLNHLDRFRLGQHGEWLHEYIEQSWDELYLHFVGKEQAGFIEAFGEKVLPQLSPTAPPQAVIA
jgi:hypothetical protein